MPCLCFEAFNSRSTSRKGPSRTGSLPVLDEVAFLKRMRAKRQMLNPETPVIDAMYSSIVDGFVTAPELMMLPFDDHMVVRGHAVFDTATVSKGRLYRLNIHLDRFFNSAREARLKLPFGDSEEENRRRITELCCQLCAVSGRRDGTIRMFISAGPGDLGFWPDACEPAIYIVIHQGLPGMGDCCQLINEATLLESGPVPIKPPLLATIKSNNYMLNCMQGMEARDKGGGFGIMVRDDDTVLEGCVANCAVVTKEGVLITPTFDNILNGTTVRKVMELARVHLVKAAGGLLRDVRQEVLKLPALYDAAELFLTCADLKVFAVGKLDGKTIGTGQRGPVAVQLHKLLQDDAQNGTGDHIEVKY